MYILDLCLRIVLLDIHHNILMEVVLVIRRRGLLLGRLDILGVIAIINTFIVGIIVSNVLLIRLIQNLLGCLLHFLHREELSFLLLQSTKIFNLNLLPLLPIQQSEQLKVKLFSFQLIDRKVVAQSLTSIKDFKVSPVESKREDQWL